VPHDPYMGRKAPKGNPPLVNVLTRPQDTFSVIHTALLTVTFTSRFDRFRIIG
jgi:hypothetical protein